MALIDNLISYYKFEESSGNAIDTHGSNDLTNTGVIFSQTGLIDNSYVYSSGDKSQINSFTLPTTNNQYSWNWWAFSTDEGGIFFEYASSGRNDVYTFQYNVGNTFSSSRVGGGAFEDHGIGINPNTYQNVWVMWTIVYDQDDNSMKIYKDGNSTPVDSYTLTQAPTLATGSFFTIGGHQSNATFDGKIDEFGFFNKALSTSEISELYNSGDGLPYPFTPTTQSTNINFTNVLNTKMTLDWTKGNGASGAAFLLEGSTGSAAPVNGTTYLANTIFKSGTQIGETGWYCIFNGAGSTVDVTGLTKNTTYNAMVTEYNG